MLLTPARKLNGRFLCLSTMKQSFTSGCCNWSNSDGCKNKRQKTNKLIKLCRIQPETPNSGYVFSKWVNSFPALNHDLQAGPSCESFKLCPKTQQQVAPVLLQHLSTTRGHPWTVYVFTTYKEFKQCRGTKCCSINVLKQQLLFSPLTELPI